MCAWERGCSTMTCWQALVKAGGLDDDEPPLSHTARQEQRLCDAATAIDSAVAAISSALPDEIACSELRRAGLSLDGLLGGDLSADVLDVVFSRFCIGK